MRIGLIGSGRVAQAVGGYLKDCGYPVEGLWGRNRENAEKAAAYLGITHHKLLADLVCRADVLMLAVSDDSIEAVAGNVANCGVVLDGKWCCHFSGSLSLEALSPLAEKGVMGFGLHPLQTVPNPDRGRNDLRQTTFILEAEDGFRDILTDWLELCGNPIAWITPGKKGLYHLGACLASNYVTTLYRLAEYALMDSGVPEAVVSQALFPLMESTLNNYKALGAPNSLTGPVSRGDSGTVRKHLESLQTEGWRQREPLIRILGLEALDIAKKSGRLSAESAHGMETTLRGGNSI